MATAPPPLPTPETPGPQAVPRPKAPAEDPTRLLVLCWLGLGASLVLRTLAPMIDLDAWWHLRVGEWILDHGRFPSPEPFSQLGRDQHVPWVAYSWLYEIVLYRLYQSLGLPGLVLYRMLGMILVILALLRLQLKCLRRAGSFGLVAAVVPAAVAAVILFPITTERPWLFTIIGVVLTIDAVLTLRRGPPDLGVWTLPILYVVWANVHIQFVYGLLVLGVASVSPVIDRRLAGDPGERFSFAPPEAVRLALLAGSCFLGTLLTPFHAGIYRVVWEYASQPAAFRLIQELTAPDFRTLWDWVLLGTTVLVAVVLARNERVGTFEILITAAALGLGFRARRDEWFVAVLAVAFLGEAGDWLRLLGATVAPGAALAESRTDPADRRWAAVAVGLFLGGAGVAWWLTASAERLAEAVRKQYPVEAVAAVRDHGWAGPLFNEFNWGGYLIWALRDHPVSMDGRTNLYGDARLERNDATCCGASTWDTDPELARANLVLISTHAALASILRLDPRFEKVHEDKVAVVFVRRTPGGTPP